MDIAAILIDRDAETRPHARGRSACVNDERSRGVAKGTRNAHVAPIHERQRHVHSLAISHDAGTTNDATPEAISNSYRHCVLSLRYRQ
jgi:hypothetical protein